MTYWLTETCQRTEIIANVSLAPANIVIEKDIHDQVFIRLDKVKYCVSDVNELM